MRCTVLGYVYTLPPSDHLYASELPSWVPDWRTPITLWPLNSIDGSSARRNLYDPTPGCAVDARIVKSFLHVRGLIFDIVAMTSPTIKEEYGCTTTAVKQWSTCLKEKGAEFTNDAFDRTLVADARQYWDDEISCRVNVRKALIDWNLLEMPQSEMDGERIITRNHLVKTMKAICQHRRFGFTEGRRLGIFPEATAPGDLVTALCGGPALYVIRTIAGEDQQFQFLGECYVDEMMDGQVMDQAASLDSTSTMLILV